MARYRSISAGHRVVAFARQDVARLPHQRPPVRRRAHMMQAHGLAHHGLGPFVVHPQRHEPHRRPPRQPGPLPAQVELQVHLGFVQVAQRLVVRVAQLMAQHARVTVDVDRSQVIPAQVIQVCDVVIGGRRHARQPGVLAALPRLVVGVQRLLEAPHADLHRGHVGDHRGHVPRVADPAQLLPRRLVGLQRLHVAVLAEQHVAAVAVQPRQPQRVALLAEHLFRRAAPLLGPGILSEVDQRLQRARHRQCQLQPVARQPEQPDRLLI